MIRGGHLPGRTATHTCCVGGTWYVDLSAEAVETELGVDVAENTVLCEVNALHRQAVDTRCPIHNLSFRPRVPTCAGRSPTRYPRVASCSSTTSSRTGACRTCLTRCGGAWTCAGKTRRCRRVSTARLVERAHTVQLVAPRACGMIGPDRMPCGVLWREPVVVCVALVARVVAWRVATGPYSYATRWEPRLSGRLGRLAGCRAPSYLR